MENVNHSTPTRTPHNRSRSALGEVTLSASRLNLPSPVSNEKYRATTTAANRLIDFNRGTSHTPIHNRSLSTASGPRHRRQLSKAARYHFLQRVATSDKESTSDSDSLTSTEYHVDLGDSNNAIIHFRPQLWKHLDPTRDTLNLDLFWPQRFDELDEQEEDSDDDIYGKHVLPLEGLLPMCQFRNLRALQLGGMLQSYQTYIWRTCWLNPGLEEVILEMALEPTMNESYKNWVPINGAWTRKTISGACTDYL